MRGATDCCTPHSDSAYPYFGYFPFEFRLPTFQLRWHLHPSHGHRLLTRVPLSTEPWKVPLDPQLGQLLPQFPLRPQFLPLILVQLVRILRLQFLDPFQGLLYLLGPLFGIRLIRLLFRLFLRRLLGRLLFLLLPRGLLGTFLGRLGLFSLDLRFGFSFSGGGHAHGEFLTSGGHAHDPSRRFDRLSDARGPAPLTLLSHSVGEARAPPSSSFSGAWRNISPRRWNVGGGRRCCRGRRFRRPTIRGRRRRGLSRRRSLRPIRISLRGTRYETRLQ
mmetsp:Transcript_17469/g.50942  ORF Transcript_17469/g.50942 Transcript_17469/m.50942 type:complete len:275 (-) Transcript_17469:1622-2446(-)